MVTKLVQVHDMSYSLFSMVMEVQDFLKALSPILIHIGLVENYSKFEENGSSCFFFPQNHDCGRKSCKWLPYLEDHPT